MSSKVFQFYLFADDTNILYADKNLNSLETVVNKELMLVCEWLSSNKLTLNLSKTNYVIFRPYKKKSRVIKLVQRCLIIIQMISLKLSLKNLLNIWKL